MYSELKFVLDYIIEQIDKHQLVELHQQLAQFFEQARSEPSPEVSDNLTKKQEEIKTTQNNIEPYDWDRIRLNIFQEFGGAAVLGTTGAQRLFSELNQHTNDPSGASQVASSFASEISALRQRAEQAIKNLGDLLTTPEALPEGKKSIQLVFEGMVSVDNLSSLGDQSYEWNKILKNFKFMLPKPEEDAELFKIYKSSPTIIVIIAPEHMIIVIGTITLLALKIVEKMFSIQKLTKDIEVAELDTEIKAKQLDLMKQAEEKQLNELIEEKVQEFMTKLEGKMTDSQKNIADDATRYTIKKIYNFTVQGGNVNLLDSELKDGDEILKQEKFTPIYQKVQKLIQSDGEPLKLTSFTPEEQQKAEKISDNKIKKRGRPKKIKIKTAEEQEAPKEKQDGKEPNQS